jgi:hypothetical protein
MERTDLPLTAYRFVASAEEDTSLARRGRCRVALLELRADLDLNQVRPVPDWRHTLDDLVTRWLVDVVEPSNEYAAYPEL